MNKHCSQCRYCGELIQSVELESTNGEKLESTFDLYSCNNEKSIYKACKLSATACNEFEESASEKPSTLFCHECGITETQPSFMQKFCRYCGAKLESEE